MKVNKGYLIPHNPEPENDACIVLRYPDSPEYLKALLGAYTTLGTWVVWEKRGDNSAARAASRWKESIERSLIQPINCDLVDSLTEDGEMAIDLTVNVTCNCCGGDGGGEIYTPTLPGFDDMPDFPEEENNDTNDGGLTAQQRCSLGTYYVDSYVNLWSDFDTWWDTVVVGVDSLYIALTEKWPIGEGAGASFSVFIIGQMLAVLTAVRLSGLIDSVENALATHREILICSIASNSSAETAKKAWLAALAQIRLSHGGWVHRLLWLQAQITDFNAMMAGEVPVPPSYDDAVCDCSGPVGDSILFDIDNLAGTWAFCLDNGELVDDGSGNMAVHCWPTWSNAGCANMSEGSLLASTGFSQLDVVRVEFDIYCVGGNNDDTINLYVGNGAGMENLAIPSPIGPTSYHVDHLMVVPFTVDGGVDNIFQVTTERAGTEIYHSVYIDNIRIHYQNAIA